MSKSTSSAWFAIDRDGLRDMHVGLPLERMVTELISNSWDEKVSHCDVALTHEYIHEGEPASLLVVRDNSPTGFSDMRHAFTLFGTTRKRSEPDSRGRFNYGEKLVIARSKWARIASTKGAVTFDENGRHESNDRREAGTEVTVIFPRWTKEEYDKALGFLGLLIPPTGTETTLNGQRLTGRIPVKVSEATMPTELLAVEGGASRATRTRRKTTITYYCAQGRKAMLLEMGIPVTEIEGKFDFDVGQKIPLSQDRTTVAVSYLQDLYAEALLALGPLIKAEEVGMATIQMAMQDDRISPEKAKEVFHQVFGNKAVIQSYRPDSDQEAARQGLTIVSPRAFGTEVNAKLRSAGVQTSHDVFSRDAAENPERIDFIPNSSLNPDMENFIGYVKMLAAQLYHDTSFTVRLGRWEHSNAIALNCNRTMLVFHPDRIAYDSPVSKCTAVVLHELAHAKGNGHDGVYDHEAERLGNEAINLALRNPSLFHAFEQQGT